MRHMNRVLVGTMLEVAGGRRSVESFVRAVGRAAAVARRGRRRGRMGWRWWGWGMGASGC